MALRIPIVSDWASAQQAFDFIASKFPLGAQDIANKAISNTQLAQPYVRGSTTLTWTASQTSAAVTITHGLGTTPVSVVATINGATAGFAFVSSVGATTFFIAGWLPASNTGTLTAYWVAYG